MTDKIKELLAVLDMSERKQRDWLWNNKLIHEDESLADLAFRLRDEVRKTHLLGRSQSVVWNFVRIKTFNTNELQNINLYQFWTHYAHPIHWIIAALITKELAKEKG